MCSWRFFGRARANPDSPTAAGVCDRCNFTYQLSQLKFQYEYRGEALSSLMIRVCPTCLDKPAVFRKAIRLPADPVPVQYPRPNQNASQMGNMSPALFWDTPYSRWDDGLTVWHP